MPLKKPKPLGFRPFNDEATILLINTLNNRVHRILLTDVSLDFSIILNHIQEILCLTQW